MPALGDGNSGSPAGSGDGRQLPGRPRRFTHDKPAGFEAAGGQGDCQGIFEIGAPGIIGPGRGTRASANTSGPDFTCGLWTPVKLRTSDPHRTKKTCFFCRTVSRKSELPESDPAV